MRILSSHEGEAEGHTDRVGGASRIELHAALCQSVNVRRLHIRVSLATQGPTAELVRQNDENIWFIHLCLSLCWPDPL